MNFRNVTLKDKELIKDYMYRYGEGSCQHSFVSMYCMADKYGDSVCEKDGWLLICREGISTDRERAYLFPMGDISDAKGLERAISEIINDAHEHGALACFQTLTENAKNAVVKLFPDRFTVTPVRDYSEYIYTYEKLAELPGHEMASKRYDINTFYRTYGDTVRVETITDSHIEQIRSFQKLWLENKFCEEEDVQLDQENTAIQLGLAHFEELELSGIVIYIKGELCGYAYGTPLSNDSYDVIIEKGDRRIADIYRVLNRDLVRLCCSRYQYINREEDVGVEGLRRAKLSYKPDFLLNKYRLTEVKHE
ncbi:MAG: phosphatidylglycerol lysyltransferase domain-containing protein [bacterium]|nr:phosphatidylglycerol lysyltransferase domain-containing protein [bacterium]